MRLVAFMFLALGTDMVLAADNILGFDAEGSLKQRRLEVNLDSYIDAGEMNEWFKLLSAAPHHVGSPAGKEKEGPE